MKNVFRYTGLLTVGLLTAVIVYPFLHEAGHSVTAWLAGATVMDFELFPLPYILCEITEVDTLGLVFIALSGMYFPLIVSFLFRKRIFWLWYGTMVTRCISLLSFMISLVTLAFYHVGIIIEDEDIVQAVRVWNEGELFLAIVMILTVLLTVGSIIKQKPLCRILNYFEDLK